MKGIISLFTLFCCILVVMSQSNKVTSCINYLKYNEFENAKKAIDEAVKHESTINKAKTWYWYANTYLGIMLSTDPEIIKLDADPAPKILDAYLKTLVLNFKDPLLQTLDIKNNKEEFNKFISLLHSPSTKLIDNTYKDDILQIRFPSLSYHFQKNATEAYNDKQDFNLALENFEKSLYLSTIRNEVDTMIIFNSAVTAAKAKKYDKSKQYYEQLIAINYGKDNEYKASIFLNLANVYMEEGDKVNYLKTLERGFEKYPVGGVNLLNNMINYYLDTTVNDPQKALDYLNVAIQKSPSNANYYMVKGSTLDRIGKSQEAEECYKKAIEIKPDYSDAYLNMGVIYYEKARKFDEEASNTKDNAKYQEFSGKRDENFKIAMPYFEKTLELSPSDSEALLALKTIYYRLQMNDKYNEIKKRIEGK